MFDIDDELKQQHKEKRTKENMEVFRKLHELKVVLNKYGYQYEKMTLWTYEDYDAPKLQPKICGCDLDITIRSIEG